MPSARHRLPLQRLVRLACLSALLASGSQASIAADAGAGIGNIAISVADATPGDGNSPWIWIVNNVDWATPSSAVQVAAGLSSPGSTSTAWSGVALSLAASGATASANATVGGPALDASAGATGWAGASAVDGDGAWAISQVFDGTVLAGAGTTVQVTATVSGLYAHALGGFAQALVSLQIAGADGSDPASDQAWIFDSADYADSNGEETLSVTWTNISGDAAWADLWIGASAQAIAAPVPEPGPALLFAAGLAGLAWRARRRTAR